MSDVEKCWKETWEEILIKNGVLDMEQLKKELSDFSDLIHRHTQLVSHITHGRMSYATYTVGTILQVMKEVAEEERENQIDDDKEDGVCSMCQREFP